MKSIFDGTYQLENGVGDTLAIVHLPVDAALACAVALATHREGTVHVYDGNELIALVRADGSIKKLQQKATGTET